MSRPDFFNIMKLLDKYATAEQKEQYFFESTGRTTIGAGRFGVAVEKLQTNFTAEGWEDYRYFFFEGDDRTPKPSGLLHAYLQGAVRDRQLGQQAPDDSFIKYQQQVLRLLFGMYAFIDPTKSETVSPAEQVPYYLLGPMKGKTLKPVFNYRLYSHAAIRDQQPEFRDPPNKWLRFILAFNEFTRDTLPFAEQDFVRLFNYPAYQNKRSLAVEQEKHLLYIPSGEMDHCILQWLFLYIQDRRKTYPENLLQEELALDLKLMDPKIEEFYRKNSGSNYIVPNYHPTKPGRSINYVTPAKKLVQWLRLWGLLTDKEQPTERMLCTYHWLYHYLLSARDQEQPGVPELSRNLTLVGSETQEVYLTGIDEVLKNRFIDRFEEIERLRKAAGSHQFTGGRRLYKLLLQDYLELLNAWTEDAAGHTSPWAVFAERCRFRPFVHLLFRNFATAVSPNFVETTARGFIVFPIMSTDSPWESIRHTGYFLGHIKDSDAAGHTLFDSLIRPGAAPFGGYPNQEDYLIELKQVITYLGRIEIEKTYYRGIVRMHQENARKQSIHSAVAACMSRNLSHTTGSHKSPWFKAFLTAHLSELKDIYRNGEPQLQGETLKAISNLNDWVPEDSLAEQAPKFIADLQTHLLTYYDFLNDNMEFIADITTSYDAEKPTTNFLIKDIYHEYATLSLMHYGLFDDKAMSKNIRLYNAEDKDNYFNQGSVSIPNGQLGKSAFFIILENVMRNFYKHAHEELYEHAFSLKVSSLGVLADDFWCVDFFDMAKNPLTIAERGPELLERINKGFIERSIIQSNGELRSEGWGFSEMKACCAYLVNFPISSLDMLPNTDDLLKTDEQQSFYPLLQAGYYTDEGNRVEDLKADPLSRNLGYRFFLRKAKKLGVDYKAPHASMFQQDTSGFERYGIKLLPEAELTGKNPFEILLLRAEHPAIDKNQRFFYDDAFCFADYETPEALEEYAWRQYIRRKYPDEQKEIRIVNTLDKLKAIPDEDYSQVLLVDDHAEIAGSEGFNPTDLQRFLWYLPFDKRTKRDANLFNTSRRNELVRMKLIETVRTGITIYDERIQEETNAVYENIPALRLRDIHGLGGVYIPGPHENLKEEGVIAALQQMIAARFNAGENYVILHFTLFEKLAAFHGYNNNILAPNNLEDYYKKLVKAFKLDNGKRFLVFCSGRGRPSNLFKGCYYVHLSTLQYFTIRTISKYSLVNLLKSLRKI